MVESIEHEDGPHDTIEDVEMYESETSDGSGVQLNMPDAFQQEAAFPAASAGHEYTEITLTETELSYLEDTSILIQNHTPTNPFVTDTIPSPQASRRQQTVFASRVPAQADGLRRNLFEAIPRLVPHPFDTTALVRGDSFSRIRDLDNEEALLDDEDSFEDARGQHGDTSIVTQIHIQEGVRTDIAGQDVLETKGDKMLLD